MPTTSSESPLQALVAGFCSRARREAGSSRSITMTVPLRSILPGPSPRPIRSAGADWSWQFGGHHLAINVAVTAAGAMSMSPSFIGIEPAKFLLDGAAAAPLRDHGAGGVALLGALSGEQRNAAIVARRPRELYAGAGDDGVIPPVEGSRVAGWPAERQRQLLDLIGLWVGVMPRAAAERRLAEIESELPDVRFAWNGPADGSGSIYYRIQGPTLLIEFSAQGSLGVESGHYHYRNPISESG